MAWSTRELADTTERTVRHYHDIGLLEQPRRRTNGYKQYGVAHLVRVLRVKLLTDLGFSLSQISAMGDIDNHPTQALADLDEELAATIARLQRARTRLALVLGRSTPTDLPADLALTEAAAEAGLTEADRAFMVVLTRVLGPRFLDTQVRAMQDYRSDPAVAEFDHLPVDADERTRAQLGERLARHVADLFRRYPDLRACDAPRGASFAAGRVLRRGRDRRGSQRPLQHRTSRRARPGGAPEQTGAEPPAMSSKKSFPTGAIR